MRSQLLLCASVLALAVAACGGDDTSLPLDSGTADTSTQKDATSDTGQSDTGTDSSTVDSSTDSSTVDSGADVDAGPQPVNGCTQFVDKSSQNDLRVIDFPLTAGAVQYSPNCMKVKASQTVTWNGSFTFHPLVASGGDSGNPVTLTNTGVTKGFAFPTAGTYGFACQFHGGTTMFGAIQVVP